MSIIINFFGGPGIGKSTQSSGLFAEMKKKHMDVEITYEFAKNFAWEENFSPLKDQFYVSANQHRKISRLFNKVKYIIVDSPLILGLTYKNMNGGEMDYPLNLYDEKFDTFILDLFNKYENLNILLTRDDSTYNESGRFQDLNEAKVIDNDIKQRLINNNIQFVEFPVHEKTYIDIFNYITLNKI